MECYSDSDWVRDPEDRRSTTGLIFLLNGVAISWSSSKQRSIALSTCHAELKTANEAACHGIWITNFLQEIGVFFSKPLTRF